MASSHRTHLAEIPLKGVSWIDAWSIALYSRQMFGHSIGEYIRFQRWILALIVLVFAVRLGASLAGRPTEEIRWISMSAVGAVALIYVAVAVHTKRFGSYKQLFGLLLIQNVLSHTLIASAILLGILTGSDNIFTAPEYFGGEDGKNWLHVLAHLLAGVLAAVVGWLLGSLILLITRKVAPARNA